MGALGRLRRKVEGAEADKAEELGEREMGSALLKAADKRGMSVDQYIDLSLFFAMAADGVIHMKVKEGSVEFCFAPEKCSCRT